MKSWIIPLKAVACVTAVSFSVTPASAQTPRIEPGQTITATIDAPSETDSYSFSGKEGEAVIISMNVVSGDLDPELALYDPMACVEKRAGSPFRGGTAKIVHYKLRKTGTYTIVCFDDGRTRSGKYMISLDKIPGPHEPIAAGQTKSGEIAQRSSAKCYCFTGAAGAAVEISLTALPTGRLDPQIDLYDPDAVCEAQAGSPFLGGTATIANHRLLKSGTYTIVCFDDGDGRTGAYKLSLTMIPSSGR